MLVVELSIVVPESDGRVVWITIGRRKATTKQLSRWLFGIQRLVFEKIIDKIKSIKLKCCLDEYTVFGLTMTKKTNFWQLPIYKLETEKHRQHVTCGAFHRVNLRISKWNKKTCLISS